MSDPSQTAAAEADAPAPAKPGFGQLAPAFTAASDVNPHFNLRSLGGRWTVLMFYGSLAPEFGRRALAAVMARRRLFDDVAASFFGISNDPDDKAVRGLKNSMPGLRYFWDFDRKVVSAYGLSHQDRFEPYAFLLDRSLRIAASAPLDRIDDLLDQMEAFQAAEGSPPPDLGAPVLTIPRVLEPAFCRELIDYYERTGGEASGFMREIDGVTYGMKDDRTKRRRDVTIVDEAVRAALRESLVSRLAPMIQQAFCWWPTRIERYIVACYTAEEKGFFAPHRDNTTGGTAHRRFAVSINLNDGFDGGDLRFPEFSARTYRPPLGGATVFNCSLLHEATPVTAGVRYATLPFLYDESGARLREANLNRIARDPMPTEASVQALART